MDKEETVRDILKEDVEWLEDMPTGSDLDKYRESASFSWKRLRIVLEDPDVLKLKMRLWSAMENDPDYHSFGNRATADERKRITTKQSSKLDHRPFVGDVDSLKMLMDKVETCVRFYEAVTMFSPSLGLKQGIGIFVPSATILFLGTERHLSVVRRIWNKEFLACFALTEIGHGSNAAMIRTTATYEPRTQSFIIHTPDFQAAKCWIGNLGKTAAIAVVFAQLITKGVKYGLHAFIVPIRDPKTYLPYPGIIAGDVGEKIGHNDFDLGYVEFNHYKIPKHNLLNKMSDVTIEGEYKSIFSDPQKYLGRVFNNLTIARYQICAWSVNRMALVATTATRYAAVRKQFSVSNQKSEEENPIIEYELHQWRVFPYLAAACITRIFMSEFSKLYMKYFRKSWLEENVPNLDEINAEIHCMISALKPLLTSICRDAIRECRDACGGHGYFKSAKFGDMANDHEACVTYEGDNNVLVQQTSKWILQHWNDVQSNPGLVSPLGSVEFFRHGVKILEKKFDSRSKLTLESVRDAYEWLITWLVVETRKSFVEEMTKGASRLAANNKSQVYKASTLSKAYGEMIILHYCMERIKKLITPESDSQGLKNVLDKLILLHSLTRLESHLTIFYQGGYCEGPDMAKSVKSKILKLCAELKPEAVSIADALAPPDFILNSVLGMSDGKVYERLEHVLKCNPGSLERATWWTELLKGAQEYLIIPS